MSVQATGVEVSEGAVEVELTSNVSLIVKLEIDTLFVER